MSGELEASSDTVNDQERTFGDIARKYFYRGPEHYADADERVKKDTVLFLTPLAATAAHFVHPRRCRSILGQVFNGNIPNESKEHASIVKSLYNITHCLGGRLINSANGRDNRERQLAQYAWRTAPPPARTNHEWYHMLMLNLVMDRVVFAYGDIHDNSVDDRPLQTGLINPYPVIPEMKKIHDKFVKWKESTTEFIELWEQAYTLNNNRSLFPNICDTPKDLSAIVSNADKGASAGARTGADVEQTNEHARDGGDEVINSLVGGLRQTHTASRVNTIFNNFSMTALALRALVLVSRIFALGFRRY